MKILVLNSGSSSIKYKLYEVTGEDDRFSALAEGGADRIGISGAFIKHRREGGKPVQLYMDLANHKKAIDEIIKLLVDGDHGVLESIEELGGVGHRVVHGGEDFTDSVLIDEDVIKALHVNSVLAPLHNPPNLMGIEAVTALLPDIKQVSVFDTALHQTMPKKAFLYALPKEQYTTHKIRRYGFHGTSHGYVAHKAAEALGKPLEALKMITCHIGNGGSITAFEDGKSIDTSMGFTPLAGIMMGTRCGDLDPYIPLHIMESQNLTPAEVSGMMNKSGGLLAISGKRDVRDIMEGVREGNKGCIDAIEMFVYRIQKYIGAYAAAMNGVDAIVFTAGVGENEFNIRRSILGNFGYVGLKLDEQANSKNATIVTTEDSKVAALVIHTNEELVIAIDTFNIINS
ncbi:MAG: acetate kinase [Kiritimatiellales bacterium]|nr:acetate kinase [Kiritimatiellales bacterium]